MTDKQTLLMDIDVENYKLLDSLTLLEIIDDYIDEIDDEFRKNPDDVKISWANRCEKIKVIQSNIYSKLRYYLDYMNKQIEERND